jgi:hypothetical protein
MTIKSELLTTRRFDTITTCDVLITTSALAFESRFERRSRKESVMVTLSTNVDPYALSTRLVALDYVSFYCR